MKHVYRNELIDVVNHVEHYSNKPFGSTNARVVKVAPVHTGHNGRAWAVSFKDEHHDSYHAEWTLNVTPDWNRSSNWFSPEIAATNANRDAVAELVRHLLFGFELNEGDCFDFFLNQGWREAEIVRVTPKRVRIEYEMPNAGWVGGWHHIPRLEVTDGKTLFWTEALK